MSKGLRLDSTSCNSNQLEIPILVSDSSQKKSLESVEINNIENSAILKTSYSIVKNRNSVSNDIYDLSFRHSAIHFDTSSIIFNFNESTKLKTLIEKNNREKINTISGASKSTSREIYADTIDPTDEIILPVSGFIIQKFQSNLVNDQNTNLTNDPIDLSIKTTSTLMNQSNICSQGLCSSCSFEHLDVLLNLDMNSKIRSWEVDDPSVASYENYKFDFQYRNHSDFIKNCPQFEHFNYGNLYYREYFLNEDHVNVATIDDNIGPIVLSIKKESGNDANMKTISGNFLTNDQCILYYRVILRTLSNKSLHICLPESTNSSNKNTKNIPTKAIIRYLFPEITNNTFKYLRKSPKVEDSLIKIDEIMLTKKHKVGVIFCKENQINEDEMYANDEISSLYEQFLSQLGQKIKLQDFTGFLGGLDNQNDRTGSHSIYNVYFGREIMFHVASLLPSSANNISRKRFIGNNVVTIIFQQPNSLPLDVRYFLSKFQHIFIVVRASYDLENNVIYKVSLIKTDDIPYFGPKIDKESYKPGVEFQKFILLLIVNACCVGNKATKLTEMFVKTRMELLKNLWSNDTTNTIEPVGFLQKMNFKQTRNINSIKMCVFNSMDQGGISWNSHIKVGFTTYYCHFVLSTRKIFFIEYQTEIPIIVIPCCKVIGWKSLNGSTIRMYIKNQTFFTFSLIGLDCNQLPVIIHMLTKCTHGRKAIELNWTKTSDNINFSLTSSMRIDKILNKIVQSQNNGNNSVQQGQVIVEINDDPKMAASKTILMNNLSKLNKAVLTVIPFNESNEVRRLRTGTSFGGKDSQKTFNDR